MCAVSDHLLILEREPEPAVDVEALPDRWQQLLRAEVDVERVRRLRVAHPESVEAECAAERAAINVALAHQALRAASAQMSPAAVLGLQGSP